ncbi:UNKNOWN [Stylonychia lemnae]|uniref:Cyclic nucleotide-binding domain-containing protein n=1 Tax=Stylonychia lemnae TaxID=5949 RepID=A0A078B4D8_STYLE|nr:UNKNOWN [Stylonychia lemnae]|eukprot:CDW89131.1 UNKNOWN [Stylonychia lemnae]
MIMAKTTNHLMIQETVSKVLLFQTARINRSDLNSMIDDKEMGALTQMLSFQDPNLDLKYEGSLEQQARNMSSLELITQRNSPLLSGRDSNSLSRLELRINNYDKPINEISRVPLKPASWRSKSDREGDDYQNNEESSFINQVKLKPQKYNPNQEFSENVMHILDRSHIKYQVNLDDDFTIESQIAKKTIKTEQKIMKMMGPSKFQEYKSEQLKNLKNKSDYFLPDIKDYYRIIERGLEKLKEKNYDDWSMLVKMCFDDPYKKNQIQNQVSIGSVELMRFHPFFNKLSYYAVKDFVSGCKVVKLRPNQLLYRQDDISTVIYVIMFGKIILHHRILGALGVLGMSNTVGEETMIEHKLSKKKDAAYAQSECYLLEFDQKDWSRIKDILISTGNKSDYILIDSLIKQNYQQKKNWRQYKQRSYLNIKNEQ